jgi:general secretion pathway protein D
MSPSTSLVVLSASLLVVTAAHADAPALAAPAASPSPSAPDAAFLHKPKAATDAVGLSLEDAELGDLVKVMSEITGKKFVLGSPKLAKLRASIVAPEKMPVAVAYQAFLSVLAHR